MSDFQKSSNPLAYLAAPAGGESGPGVMVLHAWWGLNDIFKGICDRLAQAGFVAGAPDLYDGKVVTEIEDASAMVHALDFDQAMQKILAALPVLQSHPQVSGNRLGVIGFSMGAAYAVVLSNAAPQAVKAVVLYYGSDGGTSTFNDSNAAYLGHFAENDPYEGTEDIQAMEAAIRAGGHESTFTTYPGTAHWFVEENRPQYNSAAAAAAWESSLAFLRRHLMQEESNA